MELIFVSESYPELPREQDCKSMEQRGAKALESGVKFVEAPK